MGIRFIYEAKDVIVANDLVERIEYMRGKPWLIDQGKWSNGISKNERA